MISQYSMSALTYILSMVSSFVVSDLVANDIAYVLVKSVSVALEVQFVQTPL